MTGRGTPFERLLKKQCQKGVTATKSAGYVGKWGSANFTSLRKASNGADPGRFTPKPKKFFKSRSAATIAESDVAEEKGYEPLSEITPIVPAKRPAPEVHAQGDNVIIGPSSPAVQEVIPQQREHRTRSNKFFTSKRSKDLVQPSVVEEKKDSVKVPPLKLRIKTPPEVSPDLTTKKDPEEVSEEVHSSDSDASNVEHEVNRKSVSKTYKGRKTRSRMETETISAESLAKFRKTVYGDFDELQALLHNAPADSVEAEDKSKKQSKCVPEDGVQNLKTEQEKTHEEKEKKNNKDDILNEWNDDSHDIADASNDKNQNDDEDDPEISFKDESLVIRTSGNTSILQKSTTIATSAELEKEMNVATVLKEEKTVEILTESDESKTYSLNKSESESQKTDVVVKKRSIFKSKEKRGDGAKAKGLSLYKHKWTHSHDEHDEFKETVIKRAVFGGASTSSGAGGGFDFDDDVPSVKTTFASSKLVRVASAPPTRSLDDTATEVVSVKCPKEQKSYYTVIKNVKKAHQIQDSGEFQEFNDDVDYILEGLGKENNLSTRCLSTITLASKCMEPGFRMHLRAHGTVTQFFCELSDSPQNAALALCASTVLFVLSQDRLNMDLDRNSLELMLNLLDTDSRIKDALDCSGMDKRELEKNKQKVCDLVSEMKKKGHATNLSLDHITADHLAMETLLSLTSKRAGEWFKEELRELGGLDHLVRTMSDCVNFMTVDEISIWTEPLHNKLRKADRVLKVLENVTHENEENCLYLLKFEDGHFLDIVHRLFKLLDEEVPLNSNFDMSDKESLAYSLREALFDTIRVYINLVHDYHSTTFGSEIAGRKSDLMDLALHCLFILPNSIPIEKRFDIHVLALTLIINLVENCVQNRELLMKSHVPDSADNILPKSEREFAYEGLIKLFNEKEESARAEESKTDNILDGVKDEEDEEAKDAEAEKKKSQEERIDETVAKLLHKAGRHMEDTLIASYITLIIGYLIIDNREYEGSIREKLTDRKFEAMVTVLKKFFNFMNLTASASLTSSRGIKATEMIIKHLEMIDDPDREEKESKVSRSNMKTEEESFDDITLFDVSHDDSNTFAGGEGDDSSFGAFDDFGKF